MARGGQGGPGAGGRGRPAPLTEDELIARYFRPMAGPAALGLRDDAACLAPPLGHEIVATADAVVAGVHFFPDDPPDAIGWKALAVNLSDLAAKGAEPLGFLVTLALPAGWTEAWLAGFAQGLADCAGEGGCPLMGGDTVRTLGPLSVSVTALGAVPAGRMVPRGGARPGDAVYVSGTIGDGALGLALRRDPPAWAAKLSRGDRGHLIDRYLRPRPRRALVPALRAHVHAAMDVSDGLVGDLRKMMAASGAAATIELSAMPLSHGATAAIAAEPGLRVLAATGGDDYEILCTVPGDAVAAFEAAARAAGVPVAALGSVAEGEGVVVTEAGKPLLLERGSYSHF